MIKGFKHTINGDKVTIEGKCIITKEPWTLIVPLRGFKDYFETGMSVQLAFPKLSSSDRELLVSSVSPKGWQRLYGDP